MSPIYLIAAVARNGVIGVRGTLPWRLPEDLKRFRELTTGHPVVMGRKTYESIGRLLPNRENRIVSRDPGYRVEGARTFTSVETACQAAQPGEPVFVIGGGEIYRQALPQASRLYLTWVERDFEGDAEFPSWPREEFRELEREEHPPSPPARDFGYTFCVYERTRWTEGGRGPA